MSEDQSGKWGRIALMTAAVSAYLIYDMATAAEAPRQALMILQYFLLACALFAFAGSLVKLMSQK
jgi:hypothetical protein